MEKSKLKEIASQLACPSGEGGLSMGEKMNDTNAFITERSIEMLAPMNGERVVEIGPGNGALSIPIVNAIGNDGHYIGLERSAEMASDVLARLEKQKLAKITIHDGDCMAAPVEDASVNAIVAVNVLYFIDDIQAFFARLLGWLAPEGRVVFGVRSEQSLRGMPFTEFRFNIRSFEEIEKALKAGGFRDVQSAYFDEGTSKLGEMEIPVDSLIIKAVL